MAIYEFLYEWLASRFIQTGMFYIYNPYFIMPFYKIIASYIIIVNAIII